MKERIYIVPYVPKAEFPLPFPYEYDDEDYEDEDLILKANIKELQKEIKKMGKEEYLKQRKVNRKGATAAYNEAFKQVKKTFSNMKKNADTGATKGFKKRGFKRLRERPGKVGFEILANKKKINLIELVDGPPQPTQVKGIAKLARDRVRFKINKQRITGTKNLFIAKKRTTKDYYTGVFFKKKGKPYPISASAESQAERLERPENQKKISEISLDAMIKALEKM